MYGLILDTATPTALFGVTEHGKVKESFEWESSPSLASHLLLQLKEWQKNYPFSTSLSYFAVGTGPGSLTGTRIGLILAKTYAYALRVPVVPFCSLQGLLPQRQGPFCALFDAKSSGIYVLKGEKKGERIQFELPYQTFSLEKAFSFLSSVPCWVSHPQDTLASKLSFSPPFWEKNPIHLSFLTSYTYQQFCLNSLKPVGNSSPSCEKQNNPLPFSPRTESIISEEIHNL